MTVIRHRTLPFCIIGVYIPHHQRTEDRRETLCRLNAICNSSSETILLGDVNTHTSESHVRASGGRVTHPNTHFDKNSPDVQEIPGKILNLSANSCHHNTFYDASGLGHMIDWVTATGGAEHRVRDVKVHPAMCPNSDHRTMLCEISISKPPKFVPGEPPRPAYAISFHHQAHF